jgi:hypothetical protein
MPGTERVPATAQPSGTKAKHALGFGRGANRKKQKGPLKARLRELLSTLATTESAQELQEAAKRWFFNKRANTAKPPLGIGSTKK